MKKTKLILNLVALATIFGTATTMTGCASRAKPNFEIPEGGLTSDPVTVNFYSTMGTNLREKFDAYLPVFNEQYPNITVNHVSVGDYDDVRDQITTEISNGEGPDLAYCYPDHVALYNKAQAVVRLDNLIEDKTYGLSTEELNNFIPGYYEEGRQYGDGAMYTLPFSKSTEVLYYNKTFFDANNLKVPTTWDEMEATCAAIKAIDPNSIPLGYDSESNWFITMCEQLKSPYTSATGNHFLFDNQTNRDFVKKFKTWYDKGYMTTETIYGAYTSGLFTVTAASATKSYMSIGSSAGATYQRPKANSKGEYPFDVGIASIPQADLNNKKVISQGPSLCLLKNSDPQKTLAAWLLMRFMTTNVGFQAEFSLASGYVPAVKSVNTIQVYADALAAANGGANISSLSAKVCMDQASMYYTSPAFVGSSKAREEVGKLMARVFVSKADDIDAEIDAAFKDAIDECEYSI